MDLFLVPPYRPSLCSFNLMEDLSVHCMQALLLLMVSATLTNCGMTHGMPIDAMDVWKGNVSRKVTTIKHLDDNIQTSSSHVYVGTPLALPPYEDVMRFPSPSISSQNDHPIHCVYPPPPAFFPPPIIYNQPPMPLLPPYFPPIYPSPPIFNPSPPSTSMPYPNPPTFMPSPPNPPTSMPSPNPPTFMPSPKPPEIDQSPPNYEPSPPNYEPSPPIIIFPSPPGNPPSHIPPSPPGNPPSPPGNPPSLIPPSPPGKPPIYIPPTPIVFIPTPPLFQPPIVYPPPAAPPPPSAVIGVRNNLWCIAKPSVPDPILQEALDYACSSGADCTSIQPNGPCHEPDIVIAHASFAFNSYWQRAKATGASCDFGGTAMLVTKDPSFDGCHFPIT